MGVRGCPPPSCPVLRMARDYLQANLYRSGDAQEDSISLAAPTAMTDLFVKLRACGKHRSAHLQSNPVWETWTASRMPTSDTRAATLPCSVGSGCEQQPIRQVPLFPRKNPLRVPIRPCKPLPSLPSTIPPLIQPGSFALILSVPNRRSTSTMAA